MTRPRPVQPVKYFLGLIYSPSVSLWDLERDLQAGFDFIDRKSPALEFHQFTEYYCPEMGGRLYRAWWSLQQLQPPDNLAGIKLAANELERKYLIDSACRSVNIDPGYLNESRLVLASCKDFSHRVYLGRGVFAEVTMIYRKNGFQPLDWTYSDYRSPEALRFFNGLKQDYRRQLKEMKHGQTRDA
ncbi:MAG: DUF4416 family protein [Candidatus Edwardsbacteria bacterium]|nr:DUF4416 family protein [Candidatus Edwardsbacteria bacterium]